MYLDMLEVTDERVLVYGEMGAPTVAMSAPMNMNYSIETDMEQKCTTPEFITELKPNEIFVFGSNRKGMHTM